VNKKYILLFFLLIGLADASYLTFAHFTNAQLYCSNSGIINCQAVTTSNLSTVIGVPIALLGLIWFIVAIISFAAVPKLLVPWQYLGILGMVYSISGMAILGEICEYCSLLDLMLLGSAIMVLVFGIGVKGKANEKR
jgi:uncharacterized membrane protein